MKPDSILISQTDIVLEAAPINPDWIVEGSPIATARILSKSKDGGATTVIWECTAGAFTWHYSSEETIHVLDGGMTLTDGSGTRTVKPGDVVFFPAGSVATWHIPSHVRKLAFFRQPLPRTFILAQFVVRKLRRLAKGGAMRGGLAPQQQFQT